MLLATNDKHSKLSQKRHCAPRSSLVARDREFAIIQEHIEMRKSLHVYGEEGTGKSALLDHSYDFLKDQGSLVPIYCRSSRTLRNILLQMALFLLSHFSHLESVDKFKCVKEIQCGSDIKKLSIRELRNIVYFYISLEDFCVILDHLEYVTPKINGFLTILYEKATVITASRQSWELSDYSFKGRLDYGLYLIPKLSIGNLKRKDALVLMKNLSLNLPLGLAVKRKMFDDVFRISRGNPKVISTVFERARRPGYNKNNVLNLNLIMIDSRIKEMLSGWR